MRKHNPIDSLLSSSKQAILGAAYGNPEKWWYLSELAENAGKTPSSLQRELSIFATNGILKTMRDGGRIYYRANVDSALFSAIKALTEVALGITSSIESALEDLTLKIDIAFIYGSVAKNEDSVNSDIDIMFIGNITLSELVKVFKPLERKFGREINARCYSKKEFSVKLSTGNHFLKTILSEPKIFLVGNEDDLRRLA